MTSVVPRAPRERHTEEALTAEGYVLASVPFEQEASRVKKDLFLNLSPGLRKLKSVATPGQKGLQYGGAPGCGLPPGPQRGGMRTYIVRTAAGIMSEPEARRRGLTSGITPLCWVE